MIDVLIGWGADVDTIEVIGSLSGSQALVAGQVELAQATADELITNVAAGITDLVAIASPRVSFGYALVASESVGSIADLEGAAIAMSGAGGFDALLTQMTMNSAGIDPGSARFVELGASSNRATALLAGRVDAAMIFLEDWVRIQDEESIHQLPSIADSDLANIPQVVLAQAEFVEENPNIAFAVACANLETFEWFNNDMEGWIEYVQARVPGAEESVLTVLYAEAIERNMFPSDSSQVLVSDSMQLLADQLLDIGVIEEPVDTASDITFDATHIEAAAAAGCGNG